MEERIGALKIRVLQPETPLEEVLKQITMITMERRVRRDGG